MNEILSQKSVRRMKICSILARESNHPKHKLGCVIVKGGRIVSSGFNRINVHNSRHNYRRYVCSIHAEQAAIRPNSSYDGASLYVARIGRAGNYLLSKPCEHCLNLIKSVGIRKIFYTDSNGSIICEKVT